MGRSVGMVVLDPENLMANLQNYIQNFTTAANSYTQVANQASQLSYQVRNALPLNVSLNDPLFSELQRVNSAISTVQGVGYSLSAIQQRYGDLYANLSGSTPEQLRQRAQKQDLALQEENLNSIAFQAGIVENAGTSASELGKIMDKSRAAQGNLEATQATNELVGQLVKQEIKTQEMVALQSRVVSSEVAQRQSEEQAAKAEHSWSMRNWSQKSSASPISDFP